MTHDELNVTNNYRYLQNFKHLWGLVTFSSGLLMNAGHSLSAGLHLGITTHVCVCVWGGGGGGGECQSCEQQSRKVEKLRQSDSLSLYLFTRPLPHCIAFLEISLFVAHACAFMGDTAPRLCPMGRQMYFYYLEWLFVYNQNKYGHM